MNYFIIGDRTHREEVWAVLNDGESTAVLSDECQLKDLMMKCKFNVIIVLTDKLGVKGDEVVAFFKEAVRQGVSFALVGTADIPLSSIEETLQRCVPSFDLEGERVWKCPKMRDLFDYLGVVFDVEDYPRSEKEEEEG
jgi:hypothetical protein